MREKLFCSPPQEELITAFFFLISLSRRFFFLLFLPLYDEEISSAVSREGESCFRSPGKTCKPPVEGKNAWLIQPGIYFVRRSSLLERKRSKIETLNCAKDDRKIMSVLAFESSKIILGLSFRLCRITEISS